MKLSLAAGTRAVRPDLRSVHESDICTGQESKRRIKFDRLNLPEGLNVGGSEGLRV